jgi:TolB-like protein/DNA-binding winged helix-turn-helix (wHTH) protein/Tfp pilus assembly protein PilF
MLGRADNLKISERQMAQPSGPRPSVRFGAFEADLDSGELRKSGLRIKVQQKPFQILALLLERPNEIITREELRTRLWPSDVFVDFESSVNNAVKKLRAALCDSAETPRFIETVARQGYRFLAVPQYIHEPSHGPVGQTSSQMRWRITIPVLFAVVIAGGAWITARTRFHPGAVTRELRNIAVLPIENLSRDEQQEYFADGMTDAITDQLAQIENLTVISRTSAMQYKRSHKPLPQIARELGVDAVIEGTVVRFGNRVRVSAQLIEGATDRHLLSRTFERDLEDILKLQQDVARAVAEQVKTTLTPKDVGRLSGLGSINPEAYQAYILGRFHWFKRTSDGWLKALDCFQEAIAREPNYALAYIGLADTYFSLENSEIVAPVHFKAEERAAILKALALNDSLAEAHTSLAHAEEMEDWEFKKAAMEYKRALELNPNYALAHQWLGNNLAIRGKVEEALEESRKAMALDPLSALYRASYSHRLAFGKRFDEASAECKKALELDPNHPVPNFYGGQIDEYRGAFSDAIVKFRKAYEASPSPRYLASLGHAYARNGVRGEALKILNQLQAESQKRYVSPYSFALVYLGLHDRENAFKWLEKALAERASGLLNVKMDPTLDELHADPRFDALLNRMHLD